MTIPSRPAPPPPTSSTVQQSQNGGVIRNNINAILLPPPPGSKKFPINHEVTQNNYSSISATTSINFSNSNNNTAKSITRHFPTAKTRYAPATNWNGAAFDPILTSSREQNNSSIGTNVLDSFTIIDNKRIPPPRPPPPRVPSDCGNLNGVLKKPGPPQSVNVLSNLFGRRNKSNINNNINKKPISSQMLPKGTSTNENNTYHNTISTSTFSKHINNSLNVFETGFSSSGNNEPQLITFDSPPSSPTFTQKSNSDCVSVDSFSSDSNFSSPNNGSASQPESGFEDDFTARTNSPLDPWEAFIHPATVNNKINNISSGFRNNQTNHMAISEMQSSFGAINVHPVRNINAVNKIQTENHLCNGKSLLPPNPTLSMPTIIRPNKGLAPKPPITIPKPNLSQLIQSQNNHKIGISQSTFEIDPPMPTCPPPPPPDNYNYDEDLGPPHGIALYAFDGAETGDLSFKENEKIYLISKLNEEWYMGRTKSGCEGIFPSNYINIIVPLKDTEQTKENTDFKELLGNVSVKEHKIKVLFNFEAEQPEDLTIYENDIVNVLYKINEDWLYGNIHNQYGQFPSNFIEYVPPELPLKMP